MTSEESSEAGSSKGVRFVLTTTLVLLIGLLVLQALGYGIGFFLDPASGVGEFASPPASDRDALTVALVGLVGVGMLGAATALGLAAVLILRRNPAGTYLAVAVGAVYVLAGISAFRAGWAWDASFYAGSGGLLMGLSVAVRWLPTPGSTSPEPG
ncbi:MAG: hypothetical protein RH859_07910 [Longimicrobiales bacterium]